MPSAVVTKLWRRVLLRGNYLVIIKAKNIFILVCVAHLIGKCKRAICTGDYVIELSVYLPFGLLKMRLPAQLLHEEFRLSQPDKTKLGSYRASVAWSTEATFSP